MTKILIEAEDRTTPEYNFLKAFINLHFPTKVVDALQPLKDFLATNLK